MLLAGLVLSAALVSGQAPQVAATSRVSGQVLEQGTHVPIPDARVMLIPILQGRPPTFPSPPPQTATDRSGRYIFESVAPGRYRVTAQKTGYASPMGFTTQPDPSSASIFLLTAGQVLDGVNVSLQKGAVINGRVLDAFGEPLADAQVMALRRMPTGRGSIGTAGALRLLPAGQSNQSNDLGEFRIFGLGPGEYFVVARPRPQFGFAAPSSSGSTLTATYFPGTPDPAAAQPVTLSAGGIANEIVIRLVETQAFQVSGVVVDATGASVAGAMVMLTTDPQKDLMMGIGPIASAQSDASGVFVIGGVPSGSYIVTGTLPNRFPTPGGVAFGAGGPGRRGGPARVEVTVASASVSDVTIVVARPQ